LGGPATADLGAFAGQVANHRLGKKVARTTGLYSGATLGSPGLYRGGSVPDRVNRVSLENRCHVAFDEHGALQLAQNLLTEPFRSIHISKA